MHPFHLHVSDELPVQASLLLLSGPEVKSGGVAGCEEEQLLISLTLIYRFSLCSTAQKHR